MHSIVPHIMPDNLLHLIHAALVVDKCHGAILVSRGARAHRA
jgi:hypothetical protein